MSQLSQRSLPKQTALTAPTKAAVLEWITALLPTLTVTAIEQLGDGEAYCRIINHYAPSTILASRIVSAPKNEYEYALNLKNFQTALCKLRLHIPFDINRVSKKKFNENWNLASKLYIVMHDGSREETKKSHPPEQTHLAPIAKMAQPSQKMPVSHCNQQEYPQGSLLFTIDRVKEVILSSTHDTEKVRLIKLLFGMQSQVKVEETDLIYNIPT